MDIRCPLCGEPWEIDSIHEAIKEKYPDEPWLLDKEPPKENGYQSAFYHGDGKWYDQRAYNPYFNAMRKEFRQRGCEIFEASHGPITKKSAIFGDLMDLAGDDIDFAASMMEDAETFGLVD